MNYPVSPTANRRVYIIILLGLFLMLFFIITLGGYKVVFYSGNPVREETKPIQKTKEAEEKRVVSNVLGR